jgi:hypothetical protein
LYTVPKTPWPNFILSLKLFVALSKSLYAYILGCASFFANFDAQQKEKEMLNLFLFNWKGV